MNHLILMAVVTPILVLVAPSHLVFAYNDPKHCQGYNDCFDIGYLDGYTHAQNGASPPYSCVGHSQGWCDGYKVGFRAGNGGNNSYFGPNTGQSASINVRGDNNKISIVQQTNNQVEGDYGSSSNQRSALPNCVVLCLNSYLDIK